MTVFLLAFTAFNIVLGFVAIRRAERLLTAEARAAWASRRLHGIATFAAWTLPVVCIAATASAWAFEAEHPHMAPLILIAPIAWLIALGVVFAVVDVAEDGVLDFGRGPKKGP